MSSSDSSLGCSFFGSSFLAAGLAASAFAAAAGAAAAGAAPAPEPILLTKSATLTLSNAFAKRP
jgi:hypothetical protein